MIDLLIPKLLKVYTLSEKLWNIGDELQEMSICIASLVEEVKCQVVIVEEEMKKFEEGFAYERPKTTSNHGKKPVLHGVESERNKRKSNKVTRSVDTTL